MRINVYAEEMTSRVELVVKPEVVGADGAPVTFYGIRLYLASPPELHRTEHDDDASAITFWFRTVREALAMREQFLAGTEIAALALMKLSQASAPGAAHNASVATSS